MADEKTPQSMEETIAVPKDMLNRIMQKMRDQFPANLSVDQQNFHSEVVDFEKDKLRQLLPNSPTTIHTMLQNITWESATTVPNENPYERREHPIRVLVKGKASDGSTWKSEIHDEGWVDFHQAPVKADGTPTQDTSINYQAWSPVHDEQVFKPRLGFMIHKKAGVVFFSPTSVDLSTRVPLSKSQFFPIHI